MNENIQQKIIAACGSQSELARRLGKNSQTVSAWFRNGVASTEVINATTTLKALRDAHNDHDHDVKEVQSGDSTVTSEKTESQV